MMRGNVGSATALIGTEYAAYAERFDALTAQAPARFAARDWGGGQADAAERLALYRRHVERALAALPPLLGVHLAETETWSAMREQHGAWSSGRADAELAATFFN